MIILLRKEISAFLSSLMGYMVICVFLFIVGLFLWVIPTTEFNLIQNGTASLDSLFILAPWVFLFLIPAVTMRMFAEEQRSGTIETLFTRPLTDLQIIMAKFGASIVLVAFALVPTILYYFSVSWLASPSGNVDTAGILGSYLGLLFLCSGFTAIGIFASSLTQNQIISFLLALLLSFFFYTGFDALASFSFPVGVQNLLGSLGISSHYSSMSRGVIDSRDVIYFLSLSCLFIFLTKFNLERRKW
ncbi:MAG: gliding motility-associated ABC transporter permease subunit GldF [Bacteroidetes bacterium]|nr:MAG: gliding motility-associated ABC transporter permease subunit GldF [Bacteroidota bacterium]